MIRPTVLIVQWINYIILFIINLLPLIYSSICGKKYSLKNSSQSLQQLTSILTTGNLQCTQWQSRMQLSLQPPSRKCNSPPNVTCYKIFPKRFTYCSIKTIKSTYVHTRCAENTVPVQTNSPHHLNGLKLCHEERNFMN